MELINLLYCGLLLFAVYLGFKMGKGEPILPKKMKRSIRTEEQQAEVEKKLLDQKDTRRLLNG